MFLPALPMSKLKLLLTGLAFAYKQLIVFMHTAQCLVIDSRHSLDRERGILDGRKIKSVNSHRLLVIH